MSHASCPMCQRGLRLAVRHGHQVLADQRTKVMPLRPYLLVKTARSAAQGATVVVGAGESVREVVAVAGRDMPEVVTQLVDLVGCYRSPLVFVCEDGVGARLRDLLVAKERSGLLGSCNVVGVRPRLHGVPRLSFDSLLTKMWERARAEEPRGRVRRGDSW